MKFYFLFFIALIPKFIFSQVKLIEKDNESEKKDSSYYEIEKISVRSAEMLVSSEPKAGIKPNLSTGLIDYNTNNLIPNYDYHGNNLGNHPAGFFFYANQSNPSFIPAVFINSFACEFGAIDYTGLSPNIIYKPYGVPFNSSPFNNGWLINNSANHDPTSLTTEGMMYWQDPNSEQTGRNLVFKFHSELNQMFYNIHFDATPTNGWSVNFDPSIQKVELVIKGEIYNQGIEDSGYTIRFTRGNQTVSNTLNSDLNAGIFEQVFDISDFDLTSSYNGPADVKYPKVTFSSYTPINLGGKSQADFIRIDRVYMRIVDLPPSCVGANYTPKNGENRAYFELTDHNINTSYESTFALIDTTLNPYNHDLFGDNFDAVSYYNYTGNEPYSPEYDLTQLYDNVFQENWLNKSQEFSPDVNAYHEYQQGIVYQPFAKAKSSKINFGLENIYIPFNWNIGGQTQKHSYTPFYDNTLNNINALHGTNYEFSNVIGVSEITNIINQQILDKEIYHVNYLNESLINNKHACVSERIVYDNGMVVMFNNSFNSVWNNYFGILTTCNTPGFEYNILGAYKDESSVHRVLLDGQNSAIVSGHREFWYHERSAPMTNGVKVFSKPIDIYVSQIGTSGVKHYGLGKSTDLDFEKRIKYTNTIGNFNYFARNGDYFNVPVIHEGYNDKQYIPSTWTAETFEKDANGNHIVKMMRGELDLDYGIDPATNQLVPRNPFMFDPIPSSTYSPTEYFWWSSFNFIEGCELEGIKLPE